MAKILRVLDKWSNWWQWWPELIIAGVVPGGALIVGIGLGVDVAVKIAKSEKLTVRMVNLILKLNWFRVEEPSPFGHLAGAAEEHDRKFGRPPHLPGG